MYSIWNHRSRVPRSIPAIIILTLLLIMAPAHAQTSTPVSDDDVNKVAKQMYCPVCENIPLDVCETQACAQWRDEIRSELAAGKPPTQIIGDFVKRYGDRVVGTPQDPTLRALSLVTPWFIGALVAVFGATLVIRWRRNRTPVFASDGLTSSSDDEYRARLEHDLQSRR